MNRETTPLANAKEPAQRGETQVTDLSRLGPRYTTEKAADYIGMSRSWLTKERMHGRGPRYYPFGCRVFYFKADLDSWMAARVRETEDTRNGAAA